MTCEALFDDGALWRALDDACAYVDARSRLLRTLADPPRLVAIRPYRGLGLWRSSYLRRSGISNGAIPWGWRALKVEDRAAVVWLPLWLYWPVYLWRYRYHHTYRHLHRWGWLREPYECCYYHEMRLSLPAGLARFVADPDAPWNS